MRKYLLFLALFSFSAIHAEIGWTLSEDSTLTISGTDMPDYKFKYIFSHKDNTIAPWYRKSGKIKKIVIKEGVTRIGKHAFRNCFSLTSVEIPNSLTDIADHAFDNCHSLTSITIPNSVTSIGEQAFVSCINLKSITFEGSTPPKFEKDVFKDVNSTIRVYVPADCIQAYRMAMKRYLNVNYSPMLSGSATNLDEIKRCAWLQKLSVNSH